MITRTVGKVFRGEATAYQIIAASVLASVLGFMPSFSNAPGLVIAFTFLLIVLNANLALAALVLGFAKLLSLALMPVSFLIGRMLLDGPTKPLFAWMINSPVLAWFGFEYYATSGGLLLGIVLGIVVGLLVNGLLNTFRRRMNQLEEGSERYRKFASRFWVKCLVFVFIGGKKSKKTYDELATKKIGNPIRPLGVVFVVLVSLLAVIFYQFLSEPIVTNALQRALEKANGATVNLEAARVDLKENKVEILQLAMADPNQLDTDLFRAERIVANLSGMDLLRKRVAMDQVSTTDASTGLKRKTPGELTRPVPQPPEEEVPGEVKTLEDYIEEAKKWKERLARLREWYEKLNGPETTEPAEPGEPAPEREETLRERLERQVREKGYANVAAAHLVEASPRLLVRELEARKVRVAQWEGETLDVIARNLSTHPRLVPEPPHVEIRSSTNRVDFLLHLGRIVNPSQTNQVRLAWKGLPTDWVSRQLKVLGPDALQGGTIDVEADGSLGGGGDPQMELPVVAVLRNATLQLKGMKPTQVEQLAVPIALTGRLDNPRISVDTERLAKSLAEAGISQVASELRQKAEEKIQEKIGGKTKDLLNNFLGGSKKDDEEEEQ